MSFFDVVVIGGEDGYEMGDCGHLLRVVSEG